MQGCPALLFSSARVMLIPIAGDYAEKSEKKANK
jgi:hypothetical protein